MHALSEARRVLAAVDLQEGLAAADVHNRLDQGLRLRDTGQRVLAFYLAEMEARRLHNATGHGSTIQYAQDRLGLSPRRTRELIAIGRKLLELPRIDVAFCEQRIGWSKVVELARVATPDHEEAWLARALELTCRELALEVRLSRAGQAPRRPGDRRGLPEVRFKVGASVGPLTFQKLELAQHKLSAERGRAVDLAECLDVLAELFLNLEEDGTVPGRARVSASLYRVVLRSGQDPEASLHVDSEMGPLPVDGGEDDDVEARTRSACLRCDGACTHAGEPEEAEPTGEPDPQTPPALRQRVLARDGQRCRCCGSRHRLMVHHIRYRSAGGRTRAWNLITLCVSCHALVHADLLVLDGTRAGKITFRDAQGRRLAEPGLRAGRETLLALAKPKCDSLRVCGAADVRRRSVFTLDDIPERVSSRWWQEHLHRFKPRGAKAVALV